MERLAAWAVHAYTAVGAVLALLMVHFSYQGEVQTVLWLFLAAMFVDGTDGMVARRLRVKDRVPELDGALLDNIVDYLTYAFAPIVLLWTGDYLPNGAWGAVLAALPLLASSYQFCRVDAKTDDHFFLGFPSYWNVVAFYVVVLGLSPFTTGVILVVCSVLVFIPVKYVYPSRTKAFRTMNLLTTAIWLAAYAVLLAQMPDPNAIVVAVSLAYLLYYGVLSLYLTFWVPRRKVA
jgi:phosphatidylcholine synthase